MFSWQKLLEIMSGYLLPSVVMYLYQGVGVRKGLTTFTRLEIELRSIKCFRRNASNSRFLCILTVLKINSNSFNGFDCKLHTFKHPVLVAKIIVNQLLVEARVYNHPDLGGVAPILLENLDSPIGGKSTRFSRFPKQKSWILRI